MRLSQPWYQNPKKNFMPVSLIYGGGNKKNPQNICKLNSVVHKKDNYLAWPI